ncbi:glycosyltransferase family 2 protein [Actinotalea ferrariae]|uniref:glycosyltransferase family 2 protein n=1 Tax=Actinotalea ferrariae TaxID=1386098 RepID=UPI001C8B6F4E|nr:glycosyltransferase family 2 protein [Actinotalea ferrariae]MBX9244238.1 glycosyltransferase family 2 protein [Actinotalea ferrariae]
MTGALTAPGAVQVEVVIVSYGSMHLVRRCLESLRLHAAREVRLRIHVVDNASPDGTADAVEHEFPEVSLWRRPSNDGFAVATNTALRHVTAPFVLVLNPDTEIPAGTLAHLLDTMAAHPDAGVVGCRLVRLDGSLDHAAKRSIPDPVQALTYLAGRRATHAHYLAPSVGHDELGEVEAVNGALMLIRTAALSDVGLLDERYWMYGEDLDWCVRFAAHGYRILYDGRVSALHVKGATSDRRRSTKLIWHFHRSMAIFYASHKAGRSRLLDAAVYVGIYGRFALLASTAPLRSLVGRRTVSA